LNNVKIFLKNEDKTSSISCFKKCDRYHVLITFKNGKQFKYNLKNVKIIIPTQEDRRANSRLDYFKEIANVISLEKEDIKILSKNFEKVKSVKEETVLYNFLSEKAPKIENRQNIDQTQERLVVYPFGFNISQKEAVEKAMSNKISVIEGPPGTGKTQTILNIIANVVSRNETVAVVSSNNSATKNVIDKLKKYNVDFIAAYLGNMENKQEFIDSQKILPDIGSWKMNSMLINKKSVYLKEKYKLLRQSLINQEKLAKLKQELSSIEIEFAHHNQYTKSFNIKEEPRELKKIKSFNKALEMSILIDVYDETLNNTNFIINTFFVIAEKLHIKFFRRIRIKQLLEKYPKDYLVSIYHQKFYELKIKELKQRIKYLSDLLQAFDFKKEMKDYSKESENIFKAALSIKYHDKKRKVYTIEDLQIDSENFIKDYPVILSTTYSLRNCLHKDVLYDYVIIDEASQVDICTGVLALSCAKKAVIVGDIKQLPNVIPPEHIGITDSIFKKYKMPESYRYRNHSLLSAMINIFPNIPSTLLREHYRCHPKIIDFCNKKFYDNQLIILTEPKNEKNPLIIYKTVEGNHSRNNINQRQIDVIKNEIIPNEKLCLTDGSVGIVTPYRNQANLLKKTFKDTTVKADTVDKFQGQENKVIILSTVDNQISDFTDNPNRLNVAISRAEEQLIVVISGNEVQQDKNIGELLEYIKYNNCDIKQSKVYSVFDYLYSCYKEERNKYLSKYKKISQYDSENIMYRTIKEIIEEKFKSSNFSIAIHVPLRMIIKNTQQLSLEEINYLFRSWTHVDFLIYNKITRKTFMVIEVDGEKYHREGTKQADRDKIKNSILEKYNLPLLRFSTTGSNEKEILINKIRELLQNRK